MSSRLVFLVLVWSALLQAQWLNFPTRGIPRLPDGEPNLNAPAPILPNGKPDLSGIWEADKTGASATTETRSPLPREFRDIGASLEQGLPYTTWGKETAAKRQADNQKESPDGLCLPIGIVWSHSHPSFRKFVHNPDLLVVLIENNTDFRQIFVDDRPLPVDPQPSYYGYSTARWEDETLVVETTGFRDDLWADFAGNPISESAKITERFTRPNFGTLAIEITVDDRRAYTSPWTVKLTQHIVVDTDFLHSTCLENERDRSHLVGR